MTKTQIISAFIDKGIFTIGKNGKIKRKACWKQNFDSEAQEIWNSFSSKYRSDDEAWFCLKFQVEALICPLCNERKVKFTGNTKNGASGFNLTCEVCNNANAVPDKIAHVKKTIGSHSKEQKDEINRKKRKTRKEKYGDENYMLFGSKSFHDNLNDKYGNPTFNNPEKIKETNLKNIGMTTNLLLPDTMKKALDNAWSPEAQQKRIATCIENYGVSCFAMSPEINKKAQAAKKNNIHEFEIANDCTLMATITAQYGQGYKSIGLEYIRDKSHVFIRNSDIELIKKYNEQGFRANGYVSKKEKDLLKFVKSVYDGPISQNDTSVVPNENHRYFEIDIFLPELNLAIDFNGTYWHSTTFKDEFYHQRKTRCASKVGIKFIHVFEDQWDNDRKRICSIIKKSIDGSFENRIENDRDIIIGDNSLPVFGDIEVIKITDPIQHTVGNLIYYDCGQIVYRKLKDI